MVGQPNKGPVTPSLLFPYQMPTRKLLKKVFRKAAFVTVDGLRYKIAAFNLPARGDPDQVALRLQGSAKYVNIEFSMSELLSAQVLNQHVLRVGAHVHDLVFMLESPIPLDEQS